MNWAVIAGLAAIVFMFAEPWLRRFLDARPRQERWDEEPGPGEVSGHNYTRKSPPIRGQLLRPGRELDRGNR